jgi:hypothetical protein
VGAQVNFGSRKQIGVGLEYNVGDPSDRLDSYEEVLLRFAFGWGGNK